MAKRKIRMGCFHRSYWLCYICSNFWSRNRSVPYFVGGKADVEIEGIPLMALVLNVNISQTLLIRINFFKSNIQKQDIETFIENIQQLLQISDKGSAESKYLEMLLENLSIEIGAVFNEDINQAKERINSCLEGKFSL